VDVSGSVRFSLLVVGLGDNRTRESTDHNHSEGERSPAKDVYESA